MSQRDSVNCDFTDWQVIPDHFCDAVAYAGINDEDFMGTESLLFEGLQRHCEKFFQRRAWSSML
jgi:hypothetical protein